ncbi:gamma-glutamyltransferase [Telmatospirillum sp.]|uniref:gamma-glutamyltransferase n=1 Tax=Telmatospirillum sp. TaxID=2079197 RepID=UPI00283ED8AA|nr:gamma-glutamyltransferase [Telmatospirillum sp.]MDR3437734.1 gamma-glutamyltransferase [Telmatospirillum sp.]
MRRSLQRAAVGSRRRLTHVLSLALTAVFSVLGPTPADADPQSAPSEQGMVETAHYLAAAVGVDILRKGGNAVDAAVAVGYALAVVWPQAGNLGGGGFMTIRLADGRTVFLDFRERAPLAATETMFQDADGQVIAGLNEDGHLAVAVPGSVAGLDTALARYGTMTRDVVMAPAIDLAEQGFVLTANDAHWLDMPKFVAAFRQDTPAAEIFLKDGKTPYQAGDRLIQHDLARTLRKIAAGGADAFYNGPIADAIVESSRRGHGVLQKTDFQTYRVLERAPLSCSYRGYHIDSAPPPSSGAVSLCEMLAIVEGYPMKTLGAQTAASIHVMAEAMRYAFADRNRLLGDPDFVDNPTRHLIDKSYAKTIRDRIDPDKVVPIAASGQDDEPREGNHTTHYSIADGAGNAVAVTYTLNAWYGAKVVAAGTGILLNDEMLDFAAKPGVSGVSGLVTGTANAIAPGKAPLSSMAPTIMSKDGVPVLVAGAAGGPTIITTMFEMIVDLVDYDMTIADAIAAPRFHHQWLPDDLAVEPGLFANSPETATRLTAMGYHLVSKPQWGMAGGILIGGPRLATPGERRFHGAADPREPSGQALGY